MTKERRYNEYNIYGQCYYLKSMIKVVPLKDNKDTLLCGKEREITSITEISEREFILSEFKFIQYIDDVYDKLIKTVTTSDPDYWQLKNLKGGSEIIFKGKKYVIREVVNNNVYLIAQFDEEVDKESFEKADKLFNEIRDKVNSINNIQPEIPLINNKPLFIASMNQLIDHYFSGSMMDIEIDPDESIEEQIKGMTQEEVMEIFDQILSEAEIDEEVLHLSSTKEKWLQEIYNSKQYKDALKDNLKKNKEMEELYEAEKKENKFIKFIKKLFRSGE